MKPCYLNEGEKLIPVARADFLELHESGYGARIGLPQVDLHIAPAALSTESHVHDYLLK
jgi:hypothetical protein